MPKIRGFKLLKYVGLLLFLILNYSKMNYLWVLVYLDI